MQRREFLQKSALALGAMAIGQDLLAMNKTIGKFGCQLYSIRDVLPLDPKKYMAELASYGYEYFESYGSDPFWGMSAADCKKFLADNGVKMISAHIGLEGTTEAMVAKAAEGGLKYFVCPAIGPQANKDAWMKKAELFNQHGELCKKYGIQYGYHNHSYSFTMNNGAMGQKILLENTDPKLVIFELDMCWSEAAGADTIAHLKEHGKRYKLCHIKQLVDKNAKSPKQTDLDKGNIDYKNILAEAKRQGVECFLVEQEQYPASPMLSMASNAKFLKGFQI